MPCVGIDMGTQRQATLRSDRGARPRRLGLQVISHFDVIAFSRMQILNTSDLILRKFHRSDDAWADNQVGIVPYRRVGSLQLLSRLAVRAALTRESNVQQLPLPPRLRASVAALFANTIR